ncbi:MAG: hypothetical protein JJD92_00205 [Frankiaceae bacterium]|nr:hypothetical protein [Frankiaceae bacterium]
MRALALTLAAVAALSACGGSDGEPQTAPPVSSSPVSAASPTPAADDVPAEAKAATSAGAEAFARFFYAQTVRAFETKNPDLIKDISAPGCESCERYVQSVAQLRDNNERIENYVVTVTLAVAPAVTGEAVRVDLTYSLPEAVRYDASGKVLAREGPFKRVDVQMNLVRSGDTWLVEQAKALRRLK